MSLSEPSGHLTDVGPFSIDFDREPDQGAYVFVVRDQRGDEYATVYNGDFREGLRQALHYADPELAALHSPDYYFPLRVVPGTEPGPCP